MKISTLTTYRYLGLLATMLGIVTAFIQYERPYQLGGEYPFISHQHASVLNTNHWVVILELLAFALVFFQPFIHLESSRAFRFNRLVYLVLASLGVISAMALLDLRITNTPLGFSRSVDGINIIGAALFCLPLLSATYCVIHHQISRQSLRGVLSATLLPLCICYLNLAASLWNFYHLTPIEASDILYTLETEAYGDNVNSLKR